MKLPALYHTGADKAMGGLTTRNLRVMLKKEVRTVTGAEMVKKLRGLGFQVLKVSKGSHYHMVKGSAYVIVPHHHKELGKGLYNRILLDANLK
jgi:predicted RNA binding protein YcfA (HicA-like mRNA interferase family)